MSMENQLLSLKQVAKITGVSPATVNYYTNIGLFKVAERQGNSRFYDRKITLERLRKVKELRKRGYSLSLVKQMLTGGA